MLQRGEEILKEEPFVFVLKSTLRKEKCEFCFSPAELRCSQCQYWRYCNRRCQKLAWSLHRLECDKLKQIPSPNVPDSAHLLIRILLKLQNGCTSKSADKDSEAKRPFDDLMSHADDIRGDQRRMEHFSSVAIVVQSFFGETKLLDEQYLLELFGKICINSFNILDNDLNTVGTGIYLNASMLDHSCNPNAVAVFSGTRLYIRSIKDIPDFKFNKVRISYIDVLSLSSDRKKELESMYYFLCDCDRCSNKVFDDLMLSVRCFSNDCSGLVPLTENLQTKFVCDVCGHIASEKNLRKCREITQLSDNHIQNMSSRDAACIDICKMILLKQEKILSDFNLRKVRILDLAFEASINLQQWDNAMKYGSQLLPAFRKYYDLYHPLVGQLNLKLLKLTLLQNDQEKCISLFEEATRILSVTHGTSHSLFETLKKIMWG